MQITRAQTTIRYDSPNLYGLDFTAGYTKNPYRSPNNSQPAQSGRSYEDGGTWWERVRYNNGKFTAFASKLDVVLQGGYNNSLQGTYLNAVLPGFIQGPLDTHAYRGGAGYTIDGFKFGAVYDHTAVDNGIIGTNLRASRGVLEIPLSYSWGDNAVYATYNRAGNTSNIDHSGATQWDFGYDYAFTKRIFAGVFLTLLSNQANGNYVPFLSSTTIGGTAPGTGENFRQISFDINYWF
jgi:predicted porin